PARIRPSINVVAERDRHTVADWTRVEVARNSVDHAVEQIRAAMNVADDVNSRPIEDDRMRNCDHGRTSPEWARTFPSKCSLGCRRLDDRFPQLALVRQKPVVVTPQSLLERCRGRPTQRSDAVAVEQLARCSVRSRPVVDNAPLKAHTTFNVFGEFSNRDVV